MSPESETAGHETYLKEHLLVRWPQTFGMFRHVKDCIKLSEETHHGSPGLLEVWEYDTGGIQGLDEPMKYQEAQEGLS